jgi:hypothetical protein
VGDWGSTPDGDGPLPLAYVTCVASGLGVPPMTPRGPLPNPSITNKYRIADREVPAVRYRGKRPSLPKGLPDETRAWWDAISTMPVAATWQPEDWQFALTTARVHARFVRDGVGAEELRRREIEMGVTADAKRRHRIVSRDQEPPIFFKKPPPRAAFDHAVRPGQHVYRRGVDPRPEARLIEQDRER